MELLKNQAADGSSVTFAHFGGASGLLNLYVAGDLGGGTLTVEAEVPDESVFVPVAEVTEPGMHVVSAAPFVGRITLAGATAPDVSVWVEAESDKATARVREDV